MFYYERRKRGSIRVREQVLERRPRETGFKALGSLIQFDGSFANDLEHRTGKLWGAFWANQNYLCATSVSANSRLKFLSTMAKQVLGWCWGSWHLTKKQKENLRGVQQAMLRKMFKAPPMPEPGMDFELFEKWARRIKHFKNEAGCTSFDILQARAIFDWAGHVARLPGHRKDFPLATSVLIWKGIRAQILHEKRYKTQGHHRTFRPWRWEQNVWGAFGAEWWTEAQDYDAWRLEAHHRVYDKSARYAISERAHRKRN